MITIYPYISVQYCTHDFLRVKKIGALTFLKRKEEILTGK